MQAKKSSTTSYNNNMGIGLPYFNMVKKPDPYPQSLVVRVRFKDGGNLPDICYFQKKKSNSD
jgi:hypothetical protein